MDDDLTVEEFLVYGVLAAAKRITGPNGARRAERIEMVTGLAPMHVYGALTDLEERGWVRTVTGLLGIYYQAVGLTFTPDPE